MEAPGECPVCGRIDSVQRITALYNASVSTSTSQQQYVASGGKGQLYTSSQPVTTTQQTVLGKMLAPPKPRKFPLPPGEQTTLICVVFVVVALYIAGQSGIFTQIDETVGEHGIWAYLAGLMALFPLTWLLTRFVFFREGHKERKRLVAREFEHQQRRRAQWEQFCYCHRCNAVYISGDSRAVPPEELEELYIDEES